MRLILAGAAARASWKTGVKCCARQESRLRANQAHLGLQLGLRIVRTRSTS